jgi:uncharacterized membrane protein
MLRSVLIGALAGARSMTPLAAVSDAARRDALPADSGAPALLGQPAVAAGTLALAAGEIAGDKWRHAPDRIVLAGIAGRVVTGAIAGAALAPREQRVAAALVGAAAAVGAAYLTFAARMRAMRRYGQVPTGLVEDALVVGGSWWVVNRMGAAR